MLDEKILLNGNHQLSMTRGQMSSSTASFQLMTKDAPEANRDRHSPAAMKKAERWRALSAY